MDTTIELDLEGMTCAACANRIERVLSRQPGVTSATVNFAAERARVITDAARLPELVEAVERAGYLAREHTEDGRVATSPARAMGIRAAAAGALAAPAMAIGMTAGMNRTAMAIVWALATPVQFVAGWPFLRNAVKQARHLDATMDTLVAIGTLAAYFYSVGAFIAGRHDTYFEISAAVIAFILLGRYLEVSARGRASAAIRALLELGAKRAVVIRDGIQVEIDVSDMLVGDLFLVRPGEKIATDGVVRDGASAVDESMVTGESAPRDRGPGEQVIGGTINREGSLTVEATKIGAETALSQIVRLVEEAQDAKAPVQRLVDRVSRVFVPVVIVIALATFAGWLLTGHGVGDALIPAVAVLIVACPCAMGLATPVAIMVGTGRGASLGVLIRGADALQAARRIDAVVLDKTGTLTRGAMSVVASSGDDMLARAAAVEALSEHPIARAIVAATDAVPHATGFRSTPGRGAVGTVGGTEIAVGSFAFVHSLGHASTPDLDDERAKEQSLGRTVVAVAWDGKVHGLIALADTLKPGVRDVVAALPGRVLLVTGDNEQTARAIAAEAGIDEVRAEVLPADKVEVVRALQAEGLRVAMVGDGVNDAAALAAADVGVAIGTGTDVAIEAADLTLIGDDLRGLVTALRLARRTYRTIVQNLGWAFGYNIALIPLAVAGTVEPMFAGFAMAFSSVSVVMNALRLRRVQAFGG